LESYSRAATASNEGLFKEEIVPVSVPQRRGDPLVIDVDEEFSNVSMWDLLTNGRVLLATLPILASWSLQGTILVYLTPFLIHKIGIQHEDVGYYFLPIAITGLTASPLLGKIVDNGQKWALYCLSPILGFTVCSLFLLTVSMPEPERTICLISALCATGLCYVSGFIAGVNVLLQVIQNEYSRETESSCTALMSAWNNSIIMFGRMFGSIIMGGILFDFGDYDTVLWTQGGFHVLSLIAAVVSYLVVKRNNFNGYTTTVT